MRTVLAIRHAHSPANETTTVTDAEDLAFANKNAGLTKRGERECEDLTIELSAQYSITPWETPVAVSDFRRTKLTAKLLGFSELLTQPYAELNEVEHGMDLEVLRTMLRKNQIPPVALQAAKKTLEQAPKEQVWVTHGLLIAGLCSILGMVTLYDRAVPRQCEVRRLIF